MTLCLLQLVFREELAVAAANATLLLSILNLLLKVLVLVLVLVSGVRLILLMRCLETETRALGLETGLGGTFQLLSPGLTLQLLKPG